MPRQTACQFFKALNPLSEEAGVVYGYDVARSRRAYERLVREINQDVGRSLDFAPFLVKPGDAMKDETVGKQIMAAFREELGFGAGLERTYEILIGDHYDILNDSPDWKKGTGRKGALDFLIFPLVARKLIFDTYPVEQSEQDNKKPLARILDVLAFVVAVPLEIVRVCVAAVLTLLLLPVVGLVQLSQKLIRQRAAARAGQNEPVVAVTPSLSAGS